MEYKRIIENLRAGRTPREIITFFEYPKSIYEVAKRYVTLKGSEEGSLKGKPAKRKKQQKLWNSKNQRAHFVYIVCFENLARKSSIRKLAIVLKELFERLSDC